MKAVAFECKLPRLPHPVIYVLEGESTALWRQAETFGLGPDDIAGLIVGETADKLELLTPTGLRSDSGLRRPHRS